MDEKKQESFNNLLLRYAYLENMSNLAENKQLLYELVYDKEPH